MTDRERAARLFEDGERKRQTEARRGQREARLRGSTRRVYEREDQDRRY